MCPSLEFDTNCACSVNIHSWQLPLAPSSNKLKQQHEKNRNLKKRHDIDNNSKSSMKISTNFASADAPIHRDNPIAWIRPKSNLEVNVLSLLCELELVDHSKTVLDFERARVVAQTCICSVCIS